MYKYKLKQKQLQIDTNFTSTDGCGRGAINEFGYDREWDGLGIGLDWIGLDWDWVEV